MRGFLLLWLFLSAGCLCAAERPLVYAGLPPESWLVRRLAGGRVDVGLLLAPGQNPHTYEPTARQAAELARARLLLTMGMPFERLVAAKARAVNAGLVVRDVSSGVPRRQDAAHGGDPDDPADGTDPHVWTAPLFMAAMATNTAAALAACDPAGWDVYTSELARVTAALSRLQADLQARLAPVRGRVLLTYHASWGYFADAYGLRQVCVEAEGRAPSARQLSAVVDLARRERVRTVFVDRAFDPKPARTVARQIGADVVVVDPLAENWDANLREVAEQVRKAVE